MNIAEIFSNQKHSVIAIGREGQSPLAAVVYTDGNDPVVSYTNIDTACVTHARLEDFVQINQRTVSKFCHEQEICDLYELYLQDSDIIWTMSPVDLTVMFLTEVYKELIRKGGTTGLDVEELKSKMRPISSVKEIGIISQADLDAELKKRGLGHDDLCNPLLYALGGMVTIGEFDRVITENA